MYKTITADSFGKSFEPERDEVPEIYIYLTCQNGDTFRSPHLYLNNGGIDSITTYELFPTAARLESLVHEF